MGCLTGNRNEVCVTGQGWGVWQHAGKFGAVQAEVLAAEPSAAGTGYP